MVFRVGNQYRNREGQYVVLEMRGGQMRVRMDNGQERLLTVSVQARILERIQQEARSPLGQALEQIERLRRQFHEARSHNNMDEALRYRIDLIEAQLNYREVIRERTPREKAELRRYFEVAARSDQVGGGYRNICWACHTDVNAASNERCDDCGWLICADGACQSPEFSIELGGPQERCSAQIKRLGREVFNALADLRGRL
jgi:hypothetical protein